MILYSEHAEWLAKILALLNESPTSKDLYLDVQVREEATNLVVGRFSDEVAEDAWSYESVKYVGNYKPRHLRRQ